MKKNKFTFFTLLTFKYEDISNSILIMDKSSYSFKKCFTINDKNFYDKETYTPLIFELETGNLVKYLDTSLGYVNNDVYENQLYYTYDFLNPNEKLVSFEPTSDELNKASNFFERFLLEEELIKQDKLIRFRGNKIYEV